MDEVEINGQTLSFEVFAKLDKSTILGFNASFCTSLVSLNLPAVTNENARCMERHLSVSDQVVMMRVTNKIKSIVDGRGWFGGDQMEFQLDGDTRELCCRALDAIGRDTSIADRQTPDVTVCNI